MLMSDNKNNQVSLRHTIIYNDMVIDVNDFTQWLKVVAEKNREIAGQQGQMHDGGYKELSDQISIYLAGIMKVFPEEWKNHLPEYKKDNDPEYKEYLRLMKKFNG
jgi:hypothetical protein